MNATIENRVTPIHSVEIDGVTVEPKVGGLILVSNKICSVRLNKGDETVDSGYRGSQFRIEVLDGSETRPIDIRITGRTLQQPAYQSGFWVKIVIIWVGDCEPDQETGGWLFVY